ncbi:SMODS domain-containing nucleotidyltransferase [Undibacterium sp. Tian12W]|uniref:SMODS domain-containing nucleotidyltransferase n=1 Tax=Undibacterium sp. Tian12W TaxID=3413054 RepID=UPI003BF127FA
MWSYVTRRFIAFQENIALTPIQVNDGITKFGGIVSTLNAVYRGHSSSTENGFLIGSWAKNTHIRPPRDVDMYYVLPNEVYHRFESYQAGTNKQSALLQEVKNKLLESYPTSTIRGDGPIVLADFYGSSVEVAPAFLYEASERSYLLCDTKNGGKYITTKPLHEVDAINYADAQHNDNLRPLIRMLKCWQANCNVDIRSFHLELLATEFLNQWSYSDRSTFFYDWMCRDFFAWMISKADGILITPGAHEIIWLGSIWKSRAESASSRAIKACAHEQADLIDAGDEWQKIFGADIPRSV